jgi:hypothetical protein
MADELCSQLFCVNTMIQTCGEENNKIAYYKTPIYPRCYKSSSCSKCLPSKALTKNSIVTTLLGKVHFIVILRLLYYCLQEYQILEYEFEDFVVSSPWINIQVIFFMTIGCVQLPVFVAMDTSWRCYLGCINLLKNE